MLLTAAAISAATDPSPKTGTVERVKIQSQALAGNLIGDSPERDVSVYLPPSYRSAKNRRYPVVFLLHGFTDSNEKWFHNPKHWIQLASVLDRALAAPGAREMIIVMPNAFNAFQGSMYSTSATIGDWEGFVARELVNFIDSRYRTLAQRESRGLSGHSMGGYGAMRIGMKFPEVFSSIYLLSPCCMSANLTPRAGARAEAMKELAEVEKADFGTKAQLASAAAWSPNAKNPPFYFDLPTKNGEAQPQVIAKWAANAPLAMLDQYIPNLKRLTALAFDAGNEDRGIAATIKELDQRLNDYGIAHTYEEYAGNHTNHVADRIETKMMPFFATHLAQGGKKKARP
jgi:S-formylglutathione hydrolase